MIKQIDKEVEDKAIEAVFQECGDDYEKAMEMSVVGKELTLAGRRFFEAGFKQLKYQRDAQIRQHLKYRPLEEALRPIEERDPTKPIPLPSLGAQRRVIPKNPRAAKLKDTLFTKWTLGDVKLGDATYSVLERERVKEHNMAVGHMQNHEFYAQLQRMLPEDDSKTISQVVSIEEAERIRHAIWKSEEAAVA